MRTRPWWLLVLSFVFLLHPRLHAQTCTPATALQPTPVSGDAIFIEDALPAGALFNGGTAGLPYFETTQAASGTKSIRNADYGEVKYESYIDGLSVPIEFAESALAYFWINECRPTREVKISWATTTGSVSSAFWGESLIGGESSSINMGALPATGGWHRVEIPFSQLGLETHTLGRIVIAYYGGQVFFDGFGKTGTACIAPAAAAPSIPAGETIWVDDTLPAGASLQNGYWGPPVWSTAQAASGTKSLRFLYNGSRHYEGYITNLAEPLHFGESLVFYMHLHPCATTRQVKIVWDTNLGTAGAYWGEALTGGEGGYLNMGALPAAGEWHRIEIPLVQLGLEQRVLNRIRIIQYGGQVSFDRFGKAGTACIAPRASAPAIPAGETIWVDDSLPSGVTLTNGMWGPPIWNTDQSASGAQALRFHYSGNKHYEAYLNNLNQPLLFGESAVFYFWIDPCAPTRQVKVVWDTTGGSAGVYWGEALTGGEGGYVNMGALPAAGTWNRVEIPLSQLGLEQRTLSRIRMVHHSGQVFFDRFGKAGTACSLPQVAQPTDPYPSQDWVWFDDELLYGATLQNGYWGPPSWVTTQAVSGTKSLSFSYAGSRHYESYINNLNHWTSFNEEFFVYVLINPCAPPREIKFVWWDVYGQAGGAYWGEALTGGESGYKYMGAIPAAGQWVRLAVPTHDLMMEDRIISRMALVQHGGEVWYDRIGLGGENWCASGWNRTANELTDAGDTVFFDDTLPAGASLQNGTWGPLVYEFGGATGSKSLKHLYWGDVKYENAIANLNIPLPANQNLAFNMNLNSCVPPREVRLLWYATDGSRGGSYWGEALFGDESQAGMIDMGALPTAGIWTRMEVPINDLGLAGKTLSKIVISHHSGQAWFDSFATMCVMPRKSAPAFGATEVPFLDDSLPAGASLQNGYWGPNTWNTKQSVSGTKSLSFRYAGQNHYESYVRDLNVPLEIGENLVFYALFHECNTPRQFKIVFDSTMGDSAGVYWGEALMGGEGSLINMGPMPAAGVWHRIEVPLSALVMEQRRLGRIRIAYHSGQAWVDRFGKSGVACIAAPNGAQPTIPAGDTVWVEDSATLQNGYWGPPIWDNTQSASGTQSLRFYYVGANRHYESYIHVNEPLQFNENLIAYFRINECAIPREVRLIWYTSDGGSAGAYFGEALMGGESGYVNLGPVPAAGVWHRVEIPASTLDLEQQTVSRVSIAHYGGQVWFDHIGRSGTTCTPTTAVPPSSFHVDDTVIVDDALPSGASFQGGYGVLMWDLAQEASGAQSIRFPYRRNVHNEAYINGLNLPITANDRLVVYVVSNDCAPPREIKITAFSTDGGRAGGYWGEALTGDETNAGFMNGGALPQTGVWTRLEIPIGQLGFAGLTVGRIALVHHSGQVWFDRIAIMDPAPAQITSFTSDPPAATQTAGTSITWTATGAGAISPLEFQFERNGGSGWSVVQAYGAANTFTWATTSGDAGTHQIRVSVRNAGSALPFEDVETLSIELTP